MQNLGKFLSFVYQINKMAVSWWTGKFRSLGCFGRVLLSWLTLAFVCTLLMLPSAIFVPSDDVAEAEVAEATEEPVIEATSTTSPTATLEPTEVPSTNTPEPTVTPTEEPTNTPAPTATIDPETVAEEEYVQFVISTSTTFVEGLDLISVQSGKIGDNPYLMFNDEWIADTALAVNLIKMSSEAVLQRDGVPGRFSNFHADYTEAASKLDQAMDYYVEGVDNLDVAKLERSIELMDEATDIINNMPVEELR